MRKIFAATILAIMLPVAANACDMAYASCRHSDSRTDTSRSDPPKQKEAKPAFGWPGLHIESIGSVRVVIDSRILGGAGVIVAYDKNGHLKVRDRTGRIFELTDPSKRAASKLHVQTTVARRALQSAPAIDAPEMTDDPNQPTASHVNGNSASPTEGESSSQTSAADDGAGSEAGAEASSSAHTEASGSSGASSAPTEAAAQ